MLTKIKFGMGVLLAVSMLSGCGAGAVQSGDLTADQDVESGKEDAARKKSHPEFYKCDVDADCVAVEKAGCCPNGFLVAVNKDQVKAYETKYACTTPPQVCPLFVVHDTRVAQCNFEKHACAMIAPEDITCGGFIAPAMQHHCPTGFSCNLLARGVPDAGGKCVADGATPPAPVDNR
jgi:hypothetical protein